MDDFEGRVAVVTGAASGMGRAYAERFAREGMRVVLADIDTESLDRLVAELRDRGHEVMGVPTDVTSADAVEALATVSFREYGGVHVLCNNAGGGGDSRGPIWERTVEQWDAVFGLNMYGVVHGVRSFVPRMIAMDEETHIVNTSSMSGLVPGGLIYGAAKHAVVSLTETLYLQLRRRELKVHAHCLCPWFVRTNIGRGRPDSKTTKAIEAGITPETVAEAVMQALSDDRFYILPQHDLDELIVGRARNIVAEGEPTALTPWEASERARLTGNGEGR